MRLILSFLLLVVSVSVLAQPDRDQRFAVAGYAGVNLSQIDGDYYFGYNAPGARFGIETQYLARPKYFLSLGVGFSQAGAQPNRQERNERGNNSVELRLNMVEVPLLFHYRLGNKMEFGKRDNHALYRSGTIHGGLILNRLTSFTATESGRLERLPRNQNFTAVSDEFEDWDLKLVIGATIRTGLNGALFIQHNKSVLGLYRPENPALGDVLPLFPYSLTIGYKYVLY